MSGGGFMSGMQTSLKNNQRKKKRLFDTLEGYVKTPKDKIIIDKKATPEQLQGIGERIRLENKKSFIKTIFYTILAGVILFILFKFAPDYKR